MRNARDGWIPAVFVALVVGCLAGTIALAQGGAPAPATDGAPVTGSAAVKPAKPVTPKTPDELVMEEQIKTYGVQAGAPVDGGFIFFDGRYLDAPYTVTRKGLMVLINEMVVWRHAWPLPEIPSGDVDPVMSEKISRDTSVYDGTYMKFVREKVAYVQKHYSPADERDIMEKFYRGLPFVKEANLDPKVPSILHITTFRGETDPIGLCPPRRKAPMDYASVLQRAEQERKHFDDRLAKGDCYLLFSVGGSITFASGHCKSMLPKAVAILRSNLADEAKFEAVQKAGLAGVKPTSFSKMVTHFSASSQLEARLEKLKNELQNTGGAPPK